MNIDINDLDKRKLFWVTGIYFGFYIVILALFYLSQNNITDFLVAQGNDIGIYGEITIVSFILGIVINISLFPVYIVAIWLTIAIREIYPKIILVLIPMGLSVFIFYETIHLYTNNGFDPDNQFWIELSLRSFLYFLALIIGWMFIRNNQTNT